MTPNIDEAVRVARKALADDWSPNIRDVAHALATHVLILADRVAKMERVCEAAKSAVRDFREDVERAVRYQQNRGKGGQQVSPTHEFAAATPSTLSSLHRWARTLTMATSGAEVSLAALTPTETP